MKAIVYHGPKDFRFESVPDPTLAEDHQAILRVTRTAICGSPWATNSWGSSRTSAEASRV